MPIPSYVSNNEIDCNLIMNANDVDNMKRWMDEDVPLLSNSTKEKLSSLTTNKEEESSSKDSNEALDQGNQNQKPMEVNTEDSTADDTIILNQDTNNNNDVVEVQNDNTNEFDVSATSMKSEKKVQLLSFSSELVKLERDGIEKLKPQMFNMKKKKFIRKDFALLAFLALFIDAKLMAMCL